MESGTKRAFYLGRYNCIERLGEGPLGETWRAKVYGVAGFEKQFAVKRLHQHLCQDEGFVAAFVKAATAYAGLDHERVARVHEVNVQGAQYYVASDLVRGVDLGKLLEALSQRGEALSPDTAMLIALEVADALGHAHARRDLLPEGVPHLGMTPSSVMVTHEGDIRLLDVGLIAPLIRSGWADQPEVARSAPYLAPEVLRGIASDARADVFSLGVLVHELLAGQAPFAGRSTAELLAAMSKTPSAPPCDPRLQAVIAQALQSNPELRLQSMAAWREQLVPILASRANRARTDLAAAVRRVARPERKTGAFPVVAIPAMPPPPPPAASQTSWAPPVESSVRKTPATPKGAQLSGAPMRNTLAGIGADDAAVLPLELVELPGTPTVPTMDAVKKPTVDEAWTAGPDEQPTRPLERVDLEAKTAKVEKAAAEPDTQKFERQAVAPPNGAGLYQEDVTTASSQSPFAQTRPGEPIPADPNRFPSLVAEDERERTEADSQSQTLPSIPALPVAASPVADPASLLSGRLAPAGGEAARGGSPAGAGAGAVTPAARTAGTTQAGAGAAGAAGTTGFAAAAGAAAGTTQAGGGAVAAAGAPGTGTGAAGTTGTGAGATSAAGTGAGAAFAAELGSAAARSGAEPVATAAPATPESGSKNGRASNVDRAHDTPPPSPAAATSRAPGTTPGGQQAARAFVPPPIGLPPVPESRTWLFFVGVATLVALAVGGAVYFVYWKEGSSGGESGAVASTPVVPSGPGPATAPPPLSAEGAQPAGTATPAGGGTAGTSAVSPSVSPTGAATGTTPGTSGAVATTAAAPGGAAPTAAGSSGAAPTAAGSSGAAPTAAGSSGAPPAAGGSGGAAPAAGAPSGAAPRAGAPNVTAGGGVASTAGAPPGTVSAAAGSNGAAPGALSAANTGGGSAGGSASAAAARPAATGPAAAMSRAASAQPATAQAGAAPATPPPAAASGNVDVVTTPANASIYIDGDLRGTAPLRVELTPGSHRVVAMLEGTRIRRESVRVGQGLTQVNLNMDAAALSGEVAGPAGLKVRCAKTHGELRILVDGEDTGRQCPNEERISVRPGTHKIGLYSPRSDQTVEVEKEVADDGAHSTRVYLKY